MSEQFPITRASVESHTPNHAVALLSPSGISLFLCLILGAAVPAWTALLSHYKSSALQEQLLYLQTGSSSSPAYDQTLTKTSNNIAGYLSDGLFWLIVGMVSIIAVTSIVKAIVSVRSVERELNYVNHDRAHAIHETMVRLVISLLAVGTIISLTVLSFKRVTIWSIEQTSSVMSTLPLVDAALRIAAVVLVLAGLLHVYVILMRLALLRTRVISKL